MSLTLSRNAVAMERAIGMLTEAARHIDDCMSCLLRDVIVSEAHAAEHNRSVVNAKEAIVSLKTSLVAAHEEVSNSLRQAQLQFVLNRSSASATTGYGSESDVRPELDLSTLMVVAQLDRETLKEKSDDGLSYDGTVVRGGLRQDESE